MACPKATGKHSRRINFLLARPHWRQARKWGKRRSSRFRQHLDRHGYITPHFAWSEMDDSRGPAVPASLRPNAIRHCFNLEQFSYRLAKAGHSRHKRIVIAIDGPYRTIQHNIEVGGASQSRHTHADASDHFRSQVDRWQREADLSLNRILDIAYKIFGAVGNEQSGTLHLDSRPRVGGVVVKFVTWVAARG